MSEPESAWVWEMVSGKLFDPDGKLTAFAYAGGNLGNRPEAINNPLFVAEHGVGPVPPGEYTFGPLIPHHPKLGADVFELIPGPANEMHGRSGFFCHGDTSRPFHASEGCLVPVYPWGIRRAMALSTVKRLRVVVGPSAGGHNES